MAAASSAASSDASIGVIPNVPDGAEISNARPSGAEESLTTPAAPWTAGPRRSTLLADIEGLRKRQRDLKVQREQMARELKNAMRRKKRLRARARQLSNEDLLMVVAMRADFHTSKGNNADTSVGSTAAGSSQDAAGNAAPHPPRNVLTRIEIPVKRPESTEPDLFGCPAASVGHETAANLYITVAGQSSHARRRRPDLLKTRHPEQDHQDICRFCADASTTTVATHVESGCAMNFGFNFHAFRG